MKKNEFENISFKSPVKITRETISKAIMANASYANGKLIDLGCGIKPYEFMFTDYVESYFGVDFEPSAESNYQEETKADLFVDCTDTKLEDESFDTLLSTQVIEHIYDTNKFVNECYRLLKKGGTGIFTIPFIWQLHAEPFDYYRFTKYSIEELFKNAGFEIVKLEPTEGPFATLTQLKVISLFYHSKVKNLLLKKWFGFYNKIRIPIMNYLALKFDHLFENDKFCLNYILVVKK